MKELEPILARIEMGTLFFFAGLFVLMQCLEVLLPLAYWKGREFSPPPPQNLGVMLYFARAAADVISIFPEVTPLAPSCPPPPVRSPLHQL